MVTTVWLYYALGVVEIVKVPSVMSVPLNCSCSIVSTRIHMEQSMLFDELGLSCLLNVARITNVNDSWISNNYLFDKNSLFWWSHELACEN